MASFFDIGGIRGTVELKDKFSGTLASARGKIGKFVPSMRTIGVAAGAVTAALAATTAAIVALGNRGAVVGDVAAAFNRLSQQAGLLGDEVLARLRQGVQGTVSDFDLMRLTNKALSAGFEGTVSDFEVLTQGARTLTCRS
jgi:hypothetical protein